MRNLLTILIFVGLSLLVVACPRPEPEVPVGEELPPVMFVTNHSPVDVESIHIKVCGTSEDDFEQIENSTIPSGNTLAINVRPGCFDWIAMDVNGKVSGQQYDMKMMAGATWTIY